MKGTDKAVAEIIARNIEKLEGITKDMEEAAETIRRMDRMLIELNERLDRLEEFEARNAYAQWLTSDQLAQELSTSKRTIQQWAKDGKITAHRIGGVYRFNRQEVL